MSNARYADPFHGSGAMELPKPEGIAAKWFFIKAQVGNCHPGAALPFGMVTACAYTGGYSSGYGPYWTNSDCRPPVIPDPRALGVSHFHQSGTGYIDEFYNFFVITPFAGEIPPERGDRFELADETAVPGFYGCKIGGVKCELTVTPRAAVERYTFGADGGGLVFDLRENGMTDGEHRIAPLGEVRALELSEDGFSSESAYTTGLFASVRCAGAEFRGLGDGRVLMLPRGNEATVYIGFSFSCAENAERNALAAAYGELYDGASGGTDDDACDGGCGCACGSACGRACGSAADCASGELCGAPSVSFEDALASARAAWDRALDRIDIDADEKTKRIFYSNLYQTFIKPISVGDDSPHGEGVGVVDFATMWDVYKSQLPLVLTLFGDEAADIVNSLLSASEKIGYTPISLLLTPPDERCDSQARALAIFTAADAYLRGVGGIDYSRAVTALRAELRHARGARFASEGVADDYPSHTIDYACACGAAAVIARGLGMADDAEYFERLSGAWRNAYGADGLCREDGKFYEGARENYSFRLLPDMAARVALTGDYSEKLDEFFGAGKPDAVQFVDRNKKYMLYEGEALRVFEGFNNETDMETPYAYIACGRADKTCEIVRAGDRYMFPDGRGGIPGNNDSGGLSSTYIWNAVGLYPASGQPVVYIGSPSVRKAVLKLGNGRTFTVTAENNSDENIYPTELCLDGKKLARRYITTDELMNGGELRMVMSPRP